MTTPRGPHPVAGPAAARARGAALLVLALLLACSRATGPLPRVAWSVGGWAPYWDLAAGMAAVGPTRGHVSDVFLFVAQLDGSGDPVLARPEQEYARAAEAIRASGAAPWLTVVNDVVDASGRATLKDPDAVHAVLADPERRRRHRERVVALATGLGVSGVDLDYERLRAEDRDAFSALVAELRDDTRRAGLRLSVTVQPKAADTDASGAGAADWAALCRSVDRLQVMLYNEHSGRTAPGPLATPSWIDRILSYAEARCDRGKVVPALKVIGMEWSRDGTRDVPFAEAVELARAEGVSPRRDPDGEVPWFSYGPGGDRTVYYEDARSLALKLDAVLRHGAGAVMLWSLGREDPALWEEVEALQKRPSRRNVTPRDR
jgi:spore germination protein YaaH